MKTYKPREYHKEPLCAIEFEGKTVWRIRQPRISDGDMLQDLSKAQQERIRDFLAEKRERLAELQAEMERVRQEAEDRGENGDAAARAYVAALPNEDREDVTDAYQCAEVVAAFIDERPTPGEVLARLGEEFGADFLYERREEIFQALRGDAAKKRMRGR